MKSNGCACGCYPLIRGPVHTQKNLLNYGKQTIIYRIKSPIPLWDFTFSVDSPFTMVTYVSEIQNIQETVTDVVTYVVN